MSATDSAARAAESPDSGGRRHRIETDNNTQERRARADAAGASRDLEERALLQSTLFMAHTEADEPEVQTVNYLPDAGVDR